MKHLLIVVLVLTSLQPSAIAQSIHFVDTVTIEGYFYVFAPYFVYRESTGPLANDCYFVAEKDLKQMPLKTYLLKQLEKEGDTVKYLSAQVPHWLDAYRLADSLTKVWKEKVITAKPFTVGQRAKKFGHSKLRVYLVHSKVRWLHLRMPGKVACDEGFNRPPSLNCKLMVKRDCDVYLPLEFTILDKRAQPVLNH